MPDLEDLLNSDETIETPETETIAEAPQEPTQLEPPTESESETGEPAQQEPVVPPTTEPETIPESHVPRAALEDERHKRQALSGELDALKRQVAEFTAPKPEAPKEPDPVPDVFEDPEGFQNWQANQHQTLETRFEEQRFQDRVAMSEMLVRQSVGDEAFAKAEEAFISAANQNPALVSQLRQSSNPAKFAFDEGQRAILVQEMGDPLTYAERLRAEGYEKAKAELSGQADPQNDVVSNLPKSLAGTPSTGGTSKPAPMEDASLSDLID